MLNIKTSYKIQVNKESGPEDLLAIMNSVST